MGVELSIDDWQAYGYEIPLLVNLQPAGEYLGEDFYRAGGVPVVVAQLMKHGLIHTEALTANGKSLGENCDGAVIHDEAVIRPYERPLTDKAGFLVLRGNLFDSAIMKTSVISQEFRDRYLSDPNDPDAFEGRAVVFDGPEDYHARIDDPALKIDERCVLFMRGTGPIGYPGGAEVVNMRAPVQLIAQGIHVLPCIGDGRQSGTSGSPSILNASPEAAIGGGLAVLRSGDRIRVDLKKCTVNVLLSQAEIEVRYRELEAAGGYKFPQSQTPWQEMQRAVVGQFQDGAVLEPAVKYQRIARTKGIPRHNH
jgi:dihydroxy-acid dehydratase